MLKPFHVLDQLVIPNPWERSAKPVVVVRPREEDSRIRL